MRRIFLFICLFLTVQMVSAQTVTVSGQVTSADDSYPLPGVSVVIDGTTKGTYTDFDGNYTIAVNVGETLVFSSIGFTEHREKVPTGGGQNIKHSPSA